jgi:hypothetical protein
MVHGISKGLLVLLIATPLLVGSLVHALLPHNHASHPVVVDLLHAVAHPAVKETFSIAFITVAFIAIYTIAYVSSSAQYCNAYALAAMEESGRLRSIRRGIVKYRRFD